MDLEEIIEKLEQTLEFNGYTLEDLINELCECYEEDEDTLAYENEENEANEAISETNEYTQINMYQDRLKRITDIKDETEKKEELKSLKEELEETYLGKGKPAPKQIKAMYSLIKNLLRGGKGNNKPNIRPI